MNTDKFLWIPFLGLLLGVGLPTALLDAQIDGPKSGIWGGAFTATAWLIFSLSINTKIVKPEFKQWATNTTSGVTFLLFTGGLICSLVASIFSLLPTPIWLGYSLSFIYLIMVMSYFFKMNK